MVKTRAWFHMARFVTTDLVSGSDAISKERE